MTPLTAYNIDIKDYGETLLIVPVQEENLDISKYLIEKGKGIIAKDEVGAALSHVHMMHFELPNEGIICIYVTIFRIWTRC